MFGAICKYNKNKDCVNNNNTMYTMYTLYDCPVRYKEMEFVIPDESFDNSNEPLQVQASRFYSTTLCMYSHRQ